MFFFFAVALAARMQVSQADTQTLASMFETPAEVTTTPGGMMVAAPQVRTVMLVRRAEDGSVVMTCATSAVQADLFLHAKQAAAVKSDR